MKNFCLSKKFLPGQTLVIVLLAMVASLTVGLAVSTRTISTLRQTTFTSQAAAALSAAEAGAEEALKRLADTDDTCSASVTSGSSCVYSSASKTYTVGPCLTALDVASGQYKKSFSAAGQSGATFSYCVEQGGGGSGDYTFDLEKDKTQELKINHGDPGGYGGSSVSVCWYIQGFDRTPAASLEVISVSGSTLVSKAAYNSNTDGQSGNGFDSVLIGDATYKNCATVDTSSVKIVRVRSLYNDVSVVVKPQAGNPLPFQSYQIGSVGSLGGVVKKVRVTKSLPALPSVFDFGLFSGSQVNPIKNQ